MDSFKLTGACNAFTTSGKRVSTRSFVKEIYSFKFISFTITLPPVPRMAQAFRLHVKSFPFAFQYAEDDRDRILKESFLLGIVELLLLTARRLLLACLRWFLTAPSPLQTYTLYLSPFFIAPLFSKLHTATVHRSNERLPHRLWILVWLI